MLTRADLKILHQASAGDFAAVDLLHVDVTRTEEPRNQDLQVVYELTVDLLTRREKRHVSKCMAARSPDASILKQHNEPD